eukprot:1160144-Pelagomonas_calceolata.AAC.4
MQYGHAHTNVRGLSVCDANPTGLACACVTLASLFPFQEVSCRPSGDAGVQLIATAHGNVLENVIKNPSLADLGELLIELDLAMLCPAEKLLPHSCLSTCRTCGMFGEECLILLGACAASCSLVYLEACFRSPSMSGNNASAMPPC